MTHKAVIRIAQVATPDLYLTDTIKPGRELWHTHALQLAPNPRVLINHHPDRAIGRVLELDEWDDTTGRWVFARCELDAAPGWLHGGSRGTLASMSWIDLSHSQEMPGGWRRYNGGLVTEVSVLTHGFEPVEKLARVVLLQRSTAMSSAPTRAPALPAGEVFTPPGAVLRRPGGRVIGVR